MPYKDRVRRTEDRLRVAELHSQHMSQREIAAATGMSQSQVSREIKAVYAEWLATEAKAAMRIIKELTLAELRGLKRILYKAWDDSGKPKEVQNQKQIKLPATGTGDEAAARERIEASLRTEGQVGNPAFIGQIIACIDRECKIRGLDAPTKTEVEVTKPVQLQFVEVHLVERNDLPPGYDAATGANYDPDYVPPTARPQQPGTGAGPGIPAQPVAGGQGPEVAAAGPGPGRAP
jgi:transcriptional regulator with XRE-family HTH domain